jgi:hypothetical protein
MQEARGVGRETFPRALRVAAPFMAVAPRSSDSQISNPYAVDSFHRRHLLACEYSRVLPGAEVIAGPNL